LTESTQSLHADLNSIVSNDFGERYLFAINRNVFQASDASTVFRTYFDDSLFKEDTFYVIAGTDSGLLYQFIKSQGVPKGSRYLFVELAQVLAQLVEMDDPDSGLAIATLDTWQARGSQELDLLDYAVQGRVALIRSLGVVHGHYGDYLPFWRKLREEFDLLLKKQEIGLNIRPFTLRQIENLTENEISAICLRNTFEGKTAVLLAGGPTLDELLPWVAQHRNDLLVIAVSRISHSLLKAGIQPDICVSVDPYAINLKVSREMLEFQDGTLLVNEYHLSPNLLSSWGGQKVFMGKRYPWSTPLEPENLMPSVGTTVTNTAFNLALETGVTQLVLVGADFCFSQTGHTHASGSAEHALGSRPMYGDKRVETNGGKMADTTVSFLHSANTIDTQAEIAVARGCRVINPAADAMRLPHVEYLPVEAIPLTPLPKPARDILASAVPASDSDSLTRFYNEVLGEVDRVLEDLRSIKTQSDKALDYNRRLFDQKERGAGLHNNAKLDAIEKAFADKYASTVKFIKYFGLQRLVPILRQTDDQPEELEENNRLYFSALHKTATDLVEILRLARSRILSRLEEEKSTPNVPRLIEQWEKDQQPGRAIQWAQRHANYVEQLPAAEQQALHEFEQGFDDSIEELAQYYHKSIEQGLELDGAAARAREYFQCQDKEGLQRLQVGLQQHREPHQAEHFLPLVQGYLAELDNNQEEAITAYQAVGEGPAQIDALMRLFEFHSTAQDWPAALSVLKTLSGISAIYSPMYADLLQATGDIDGAVETYTDYLLANPDDLNSMMKLGRIFYHCGSVEGVEWTMNYILGKDPDNHAAKAMLQSLHQPQANGT
jgi:hypothetical protein